MAKVTFVIGSFYFEVRLQALLDNIRQQDSNLGDYAIIVNEQRGPRRKLKGFAATYNALIDAAFTDGDCKFVWILGDDVMPVGNCLKDTQSAIESDETIGAIFPVEAWLSERTHTNDGWVAPHYVTLIPPTGDLTQIEAALSEIYYEQVFAGFACACIRREAWKAVGPMDVTIGLGYGEDLDWGLRCWKAGFRIVNWRGSWFQHLRGATYNKLIEDGLYTKEAPYIAAKKVQDKWPFLWHEPFDATMARLHKWYKEARP